MTLRDYAIRYGFIVLLVGLIAYFAITADGFVSPQSAVFIFQSVAITGVLALGVTATLVVGGFDLSIGSVATSAMMAASYAMVVLIVLAVLIWFFLEYTRFGRMMYAVGSNERAAELAGAPVKAYKIWAYVISGVFASIGGILLAARLGRGDIASGNNLLLDAVAAALIGYAVLGAAKPNAFGTAVGAVFVGVLLQGLTMMNAPYYTQDFVKGAVLVVALVFTFALSGRGKR